MTRLRSTFDPHRGSIELELTADERLPPGTRLAFTSIVQLTPRAGSSAVAVRQLASYHEFEPRSPDPLTAGTPWTIADLATSHLPWHSNDGPVSAFLIRPDATTLPVHVDRHTARAAPARPPRTASSPAAVLRDRAEGATRRRPGTGSPSGAGAKGSFSAMPGPQDGRRVRGEDETVG